MSNFKPVSVNGVTYQVPEDIADAYGSQLAASQNGQGDPPDPDMIISAAKANGQNTPGTDGYVDPGGAITYGEEPNHPPPTENLPLLDSTTPGASADGPAIGGAAYADGTPFDGSTGPIGAANPGPDDPTITVVNSSSTPRYYKIEGSAGADPENLNNNIFVLQPGQSAKVNAGPGFIGAITDQGSSTNSTNAGTRQEVNFGTPGKTWYDSDIERGGATQSSLGPTDTSLKADDGSNSLVSNNYAYITAGSVNGVDASAQAAADDLKNRVISTQQMTITST